MTYSTFSTTTNLSAIPSLPELVGLTIISIPFFRLYTKVSRNFKTHTNIRNTGLHCPQTEISILKEKVKENDMKIGGFTNYHEYQKQRVERTKIAYNSTWDFVNRNLDQGNKEFNIRIAETDEKILETVRQLLVEELEVDGYTTDISLY